MSRYQYFTVAAKFYAYLREKSNHYEQLFIKNNYYKDANRHLSESYYELAREFASLCNGKPMNTLTEHEFVLVAAFADIRNGLSDEQVATYKQQLDDQIEAYKKRWQEEMSKPLREGFDYDDEPWGRFEDLYCMYKNVRQKFLEIEQGS